MNNKSVKIILTIILTLISFWGVSQIKNKADSVILKNFELIRNYLSNPNSDMSMKRVKAVYFFENLTGIPSESDSDYIGKTAPTKKDLDLWYAWYEFNKENIFWDDNLKLIKFFKIIQPPKYE